MIICLLRLYLLLVSIILVRELVSVDNSFIEMLRHFYSNNRIKHYELKEIPFSNILEFNHFYFFL